MPYSCKGYQYQPSQILGAIWPYQPVQETVCHPVHAPNHLQNAFWKRQVRGAGAHIRRDELVV